MKCRQCFQELRNGFDTQNGASVLGAPSLQAPGAPPGIFDFPRALTPCPACGKSNAFSLEDCAECGAPMDGSKTPGVAHAVAPERLRKAVRGRRRRERTTSTPAWINLSWLMRLGSVVFLFWGVVDTSFWLDKFTRGMQPEDPLLIRYSLFAIYEIVRDAAIVGGVWLLTFLKPRR